MGDGSGVGSAPSLSLSCLSLPGSAEPRKQGSSQPAREDQPYPAVCIPAVPRPGMPSLSESPLALRNEAVLLQDTLQSCPKSKEQEHL